MGICNHCFQYATEMNLYTSLSFSICYCYTSCRCIAVTTTLEEDALQEAGPVFIRKDIGDISINDILYGGSNAYDSM